MTWKKFIYLAVIGISIFIIISIGFDVYEWLSRTVVNKEIDKFFPIGEYANDEEVIAGIKPNENTNDHPYFHPKFEKKLYNNSNGFNYEYSLSGVRGVRYIRRAKDGSIHQMVISPRTVLTRNEIYYVRDVDSLIVAVNKAYPHFFNEFDNYASFREQKTTDEIHDIVCKAKGKMISSNCIFTNEDCTDSYAISIDVGNYRFIFDGKCGHKMVVSMYPHSYYKTKALVLRLSALSIGIVLFILLIVTWQESINKCKLRKSKIRNAIEGSSKENGVISKSFCKYCGKEIDADSKFCSNCSNSQL